MYGIVYIILSFNIEMILEIYINKLST